MTLISALCYLLLPRVKLTEPPYIGWLKRQHHRWLEVIVRHSMLVIGATGVVCVGAAAVLPFQGGDFLPEFKEGHYILRMTMAPGSSTPASLKMGAAVSEQLLKNPDIQSVSEEVGRAEQGEDSAGPEFSELHIELRSGLANSEEAIRGCLGPRCGHSGRHRPTGAYLMTALVVLGLRLLAWQSGEAGKD